MNNQKILDAAFRLEGILGEHSHRIEEERRLPSEVVSAMAGAGVFRLFLPRSLGGFETDPVTCARVVETVAGFDSAAGWALMVANASAWWCARFPEEGTKEIYGAGPDTIMACAFHPPVAAVAVDGGFRLSGRRPFASHIHSARWLMLTGIVMKNGKSRDTNAEPEVIAAVFPAEEAKIIDTWHALGMRGTDSNDVEVADVFVPARRTCRLTPEFEPGPDYRGPLYRLPAMGPLLASLVPPVALAVARKAVDAFLELARQKTPFASKTVLRERASAQSKVGRAEAILRSARLFLHDALAQAWDKARAGESFPLEQRTGLHLAATHAVQSAARAVDLVYGAAGTSAIYAGSPLERAFRDMQVLRQHGFTAEGRYETAGQVFLGLPPDLEMVAF